MAAGPQKALLQTVLLLHDVANGMNHVENATFTVMALLHITWLLPTNGCFSGSGSNYLHIWRLFVSPTNGCML
jgi:hypothetical protein